ncbi:hypothetical protein M427DRAFT_70097 [Gonapodya prolifera JEL478]|uniref:Ankyrin repeat domain-containing protein n=1 Tax=Gonapodya prolifera (strain JEL478) TaxID=1344416 RepID=A0A139AEY1_GONPJ|nr:hypothetical protein M427DRAFT_70097 [Gonapodya prolifera JEL478]|eukprot:KXS15239.1 hypothetical protein M427DRAFT_70097 [Gonapodya prolifera JEL478]
MDLNPASPDYIHRLVFLNFYSMLKAHLDGFSKSRPHPAIEARDRRGHTPLTLAVSLGHAEIVELLLEKGASPQTTSREYWTPIQEAVSFGDRGMLESLLQARREELASWWVAKGAGIVEQLSNTLPSFYIAMTWNFTSWIPLLSRLAPSDTYRIWKRGTSVRVDTSLLGFENLRWIRGDVSVVFDVVEGEARTVLVDHGKRVVQRVYPRPTPASLDPATTLASEVSLSLRTSIVGSPDVPLDGVKFTRAYTGYLGWKKERNEDVGKFLGCEVWNLANIQLLTRTRSEHLVEVEKYDKAAAAVAKAATAGAPAAAAADQGADPAVPTTFDPSALETLEGASDEQAQKMLEQGYKAVEGLAGYIPSLPPPPPPAMEFDEYFNPADPHYAHLGRPLKISESKHTFNATVWMAPQSSSSPSGASPPPPGTPAPPELPPLSAILPLLDVLGYGSNDHMTRLKNYLLADGMPGGFPVKIEIPLFGVLSAAVTFHDFDASRPIDQLMFAVNPTYEEGVIVQSLADGA